MSNKSIWKFVIKEHKQEKAYFGFTFADSEEEARTNVMEVLIPNNINDVEIISMKKVSDNIRVCIVGSAEMP